MCGHWIILCISHNHRAPYYILRTLHKSHRSKSIIFHVVFPTLIHIDEKYIIFFGWFQRLWPHTWCQLMLNTSLPTKICMQITNMNEHITRTYFANCLKRSRGNDLNKNVLHYCTHSECVKNHKENCRFLHSKRKFQLSTWNHIHSQLNWKLDGLILILMTIKYFGL